MIRKVVINKCFGGFGLSAKALELLGERKGKKFKYSFEFEDFYPRHDKDLVDIVEQLGRDSSEGYSSLSVEEIEGNFYKISEYDGLESLITPSNIDWTIIEEVADDTEV